MTTAKDVVAHLRALFSPPNAGSPAAFPHLNLPPSTVALMEVHLASLSAPLADSVSRRWTELLIDLAGTLPSPEVPAASREAFLVLLDMLTAAAPAPWADPAGFLARHMWRPVLAPLLPTPPRGRAAYSAAVSLLVRATTADPRLVTPALWRSSRSSSGSPSSSSSPSLPELALRGWAKIRPEEAFAQVAQRADAPALTLLTDMVRDSPHLTHRALPTPLLPTLVRIITQDRGRRLHDTDDAEVSTLATLACSALALLLPRVPTSLDSEDRIGLPALFGAFARAACWGSAAVGSAADAPAAGWGSEVKVGRSASEAAAVQALYGFVGPYGVEVDQTHSVGSSSGAEDADVVGVVPVDAGRTARGLPEGAGAGEHFRDPDVARSEGYPGGQALVSAEHLFTVLYGLWPCAFLDFLRSPGEFDRSGGAGWDGDLALLHRRIEPMLRNHLLSPGLVRYPNSAAERRDQSRFLALETADLLASFQRNVAPSPFPSSSAIVGPRAAQEAGAEDRGMSREASLVSAASVGGVPADVVAIAETYAALKSRRGSAAMYASALKGLRRGVSENRQGAGAVAEGNGDVVKDQADEEGAGEEGGEETKRWRRDREVEALKRENLLLKAELSFELYFKSQHMQQIGTVHKDRVLESGLEAEVRALQAINRALRKKLEATARRDDESREANKQRKANHVQYTDSLRDRSAKYRDEKKAWIEERAKLKASLEDREHRIERLASELAAAGSKSTDLENELESLKPKLAGIAELESKNQHLTQSLLVWDDDLRRIRDQKRQMDALTAECQKAMMMQASGQKENDELRVALRAKEDLVRTLQAELDAIRRKEAARTTMLERGEESMAGKYAQLRWEYDAMRERNIALETEAEEMRITLAERRDHAASGLPM